MISKRLITSRDGIVCGDIKTANRNGIATVAVYSDADREILRHQTHTMPTNTHHAIPL